MVRCSADGGSLYRVVAACCSPDQFTVGENPLGSCYDRVDGGC
jgi:hypothetical protein